MKRMEKRLAICRDVLALLSSGRNIQVHQGRNYLELFDDWFDPKTSPWTTPEEDGDKPLKGFFKDCAVCAKGALFVAHVDRFNNLRFRDLRIWSSYATESYGASLAPKEVTEPIKYFSKVELDALEHIFEYCGSGVEGCWHLDPRLRAGETIADLAAEARRELRVCCREHMWAYYLTPQLAPFFYDEKYLVLRDRDRLRTICTAIIEAGGHVFQPDRYRRFVKREMRTS